MTARRKTIKKPSFVITYAISLLIVVLLVSGIGVIVYKSEESKYYTRVFANEAEKYKEIESEIYDFLKKDKEKTTRADIVWMKWLLVNHYIETGQYIKVYKDKEMVADGSSMIHMVYNLESDAERSGFKYHDLEIADKKYMEYFNTPEANKYRTTEDKAESIGYGGPLEGFQTQSFINFSCSEFYADFENCKFIPVAATIVPYHIDEPGTVLEIRITPDPKDIDGYTLIKIPEDSDDSASGTLAGLEGEFLGSLDNGISLEMPKENYVKKSNFIVKGFEDVYNYEIKIGMVILVLGALVIAIIPATIRYNINKRNYEIFQYRLKTTNAMAHDLKTPLAAIAGYAESLSYHIGKDKQEYYADKIEDKVSQMTLMINNILEFSKSEALTGKVTTVDVDISAVIAEIITDNEITINARNLKIEYDQKEVTVKTDKEIFKQALSNLIGNAVLHSKEGTTVKINCNKICIEIINTANEKIDDIKSIREPFVKGSDSRGNNGSGLGLAIADNNLAMLRYKLELKTEGDKFYAVVKL